jgi:hypothetical protein
MWGLSRNAFITIVFKNYSMYINSNKRCGLMIFEKGEGTTEGEGMIFIYNF